MAVRAQKPHKYDPLLRSDMVQSVSRQRIQSALWDYDRGVTTVEAIWGVDRLPYLVDDETRLKWWSAVERLNTAIDEEDANQVKHRVGVCLRGLGRLEDLARAAGHKPNPPTWWETIMPDGRVLRVVREWPEGSMAIAATETAADGRKVVVWSMEEVARIVGSYGAANVVKDTWPGATVTKVRTVTEEALDDEIPF